MRSWFFVPPRAGRDWETWDADNIRRSGWNRGQQGRRERIWTSYSGRRPRMLRYCQGRDVFDPRAECRKARRSLRTSWDFLQHKPWLKWREELLDPAARG